MRFSMASVRYVQKAKATNVNGTEHNIISKIIPPPVAAPNASRPNAKDDNEPSANYNRLSETILNHTSYKLQCPAFCKGKNCKYDSPNCWPRDQMAINGVFSHWITENIIAMARPSNKTIKDYNVIEQFQRHGIKTIVNLQHPGEHNKCGPPLTTSGFTYDPQIFMENGVYFYNFGWKDYGVLPVARILDMVKVLAFAVTQGKVAVHCHAGLGRTGVLIACYLIFSYRCKANDAIIYVRLKRQNAIQTSGQIKCVQKFGKNIEPSFYVFSNIDIFIKDFSIHEYLKRQKRILHGYESRHLKHIPKIIYIVGERLLELANCKHPSSDGSAAQINYELDGDAFSNYFLSAESKDEFAIYRPASQVSTNADDDELDRWPNNESPKSDLVDQSIPEEDEEKDVKHLLFDNVNSDTLSENTCYKELTSKLNLRREIVSPVDPIVIANALLEDYVINDEEFKKTLRQYQKDLNTKGNIYEILSCETNPSMLAAIMWSWLEHLGEPVLATRDLSIVVTNFKRPAETLAKLDRGTRYTTEYVIRLIARLQSLSADIKQALLKRSIASLTKQGVPIDGILKPIGASWNKMREGTLKRVLQFIYGVFQAVSHESLISDDSDDD